MCSCFHISRFHVCWSVVTRGWVFLAVLSNSCQKNTMADFSYKSLRLWKIDNIDLTQQFSLSIFTDFRYQSIKITWLLPIFIDWLLRELMPQNQELITSYLKRSFSYSGALLWNNLPEELRTSNSLGLFKRSSHRWFSDQYFHTANM